MGRLDSQFLFNAQPYSEIREIQESWVRDVIEEVRAEGVLYCEHAPTLTLGKRAQASDYGEGVEELLRREVRIVTTTRGGAVTYHGPGQLVIYPVVSLRRRHLGVRDFVLGGLKVLQEICGDRGLTTEVSLDQPGLWTKSPRRKIAAVGLRIQRGVTNHGFALNVNCGLEEFKLIVPCGVPGTIVTSMAAELPGLKVDLSELAKNFHARFEVQL